MKKFLSIVSLVLVAVMFLSMTAVSADEADVATEEVEVNGTVITPPKDMTVYYANDLTGKTTPAIDGVINPDEYGAVVAIATPTPMAKDWPETGYVIDRNSDRPLAGTFEYYFAYDETSIYIAYKEYGSTYDDGNAAYQDFQTRSNYSFAYGFQLDDMTNYFAHSVSYGGGCWNKNFTFSDGKLSNFSSTDVTPDQFYAELFAFKYKADEADLPDDERTLWVYGDVLSATNQNSKAPYIMEVEMRLDKQQAIEIFNSVAYTEYAECPNAMYFKMSCNTFRLAADGTTTGSIGGHNQYLITDISKYNDAQKTKFYMDYGMLPGSPTQVIPSLIVFDSPDAPIVIPADKVETEPEEDTTPVEDETTPVADDTTPVADETTPVADDTKADAAEETKADTKAAAGDAAAEGGCGGTVSLAGIALVAALGTCTAFVAKKKED